MSRTQKYKILFKRTFIFIALGVLCAVKAMAIEEPYLNELKGTHVVAGNTVTVADEKFINPSAFALIQQNISVNDIVSFEINFDTSIYFYNQPFTCTLNAKIYIYGNPVDTSQITDSTTHSNIILEIRYDTVRGKPYKGVAMYKFAGAYKYKVKIISITSSQLSPIPAIFRLKTQIIIDRQYIFNDNSADVTRYSIVNSNQLRLEWTPSAYPGAEQFDLEYTHIDGASLIADRIRAFQTSGDYFVPADTLNKWFANNNTRVTTAASSHLLNIPYDSGFILFRIRGVQIHYPDNIRWEGNWNYFSDTVGSSCSSCPSGVVFFNPHESNLNWQYSASFAEEGKRKEVISYFDGTLRNRQSVTIINSDNKTVVQETIYDALGRPSVNILPAPTNDSTIHYFRGFNKNHSGIPYSFTDIGFNCTTNAGSVSNSSGAGRYYSPNNEFINTFYYAKYIPDAEGYPFSTTEYKTDNTGRIQAQGGVGPAFQLNSGHATTYFYGKPNSQTELDRLFGSEAGNFSHYLKNMVVDPNGQISVSYVNASGKTIATALAGEVPDNLHALPSTAGASTHITDDLMNPDDFTRNSSDYSISASATFLAPVTGNYILDYRVDPLRMEKLYGPNKDSVICSNCYYDLVITVKDACDSLLALETRPAGTIFDTACSIGPGTITDTIGITINKIGEYYVTYRLVVSKDALNFYDSVHLVKNSDIKKLNFFLLEELKQTDFYGCYSECSSCFDALGTKQEFTAMFKSLYTNNTLVFGEDDSLFAISLYDSLYAHCLSIQGECATNVCDEKLELLKLDVKPGGQYAEYDSSTYELRDTAINVLKKRHTILYFTDVSGNRDSIMLHDINGEDSIKVDVKDLNDSLFIQNFKDEWADSLAKLHPEYCHYLWCIANSNSFEFDREISAWLDADTAIARGWFNPNVYDTILSHDPFFLPGGNGYPLREQIRDSLRLFSRTFVRTSAPDKNILQLIDVVLYCKTQSNGWDACNPDSACRSRNREWFLYQNFYLNLKQLFYETARRTSSNPVFANCVNCFIGKDLVTLTGWQDTTSYEPYVDSTCNYHCSGGIYNPYDKDSISVYIEYGTRGTGPSGTPPNYANCQFFAVYDLATDSNAHCKFFNVWVCTYDSTCTGECIVISYPSKCPNNPNADLYQDKLRRYPEYVNSSDFVNSVLSNNPQQQSQTQQQHIIDECHSTCEAQADIWINKLRRCNSNEDTLALLKQALIDVCSAGCSMDRIYGSSTIPASVSAPYHSFEEAIIGILGPDAINDSCTVELLDYPYPYNRQPANTENLISETNFEICQKITQYKTAYQSSGFSGSFQQYLVQTIGAGYGLDSLELDDLLNSCTNCSGLLKDEIVLPIAFEPNAPPCLVCDSIKTAFIAFQDKFPGIDSTDDDYATLFANFFNHRFGYSLTSDDFKTYLDTCTRNISYTAKLCNQAATKEVTVDNNTANNCTAGLFSTALTNAWNTYVTYIDSVRRDFREAWMTKCMKVQPALSMTAELFEYHYTLYYYDQSDNLVKTIPPEGVKLLDSAELELVKLHRLLQTEGCYRYSDSIHFNNNGQIAWNLADSFEARSFTEEMMLNLDAYANQVLVSKLSEYTYDTSGVGTDLFYRHAGFVIKIVSNKLAVDVYGISADTIQNSALAVSVLNVANIIRLSAWTHFVVERTTDPLNPIKLWINGNPVALTFISNDLAGAVTFAGTGPLIVGSHDAPHLTMPGKLQGTIKNLRLFNRLLADAEIRQNAYDLCQLPSNSNGLLFWSAMTSATDNLVSDRINQLNGVLTGFTWEPFEGIFNEHRLPTSYVYNSFHQVLQQFSADEDTTQFFYDRLGRIIASQNKEQKDNSSYSGTTNRFSYTKYDVLGRMTEVGEKSNPSADIRSIDLLDSTAVKNWLTSGIDKQVTKTLYDNPINLSVQSSITSRKRVVARLYFENLEDTEGDSTLYSYDILGNVNILIQHIKALVAVDLANGKKRIDYDYDFVSGKVNKVSYQEGKGDQFFYRYQYDADNRVTSALTSRDKLIWNEDASYTYYLHGALAREELGNLKVQGVDYSYTLQGWLKGINGDTLNSAKEIGNDGVVGSINSRVSRDMYGLKLGYYDRDYISIGGNNAPAFSQHEYMSPSTFEATGNQLFNGNISYSTLALSKVNNGATTGYSYGYDQLNRLTEMREHSATGSWSNTNIISAYSESIAYDANGNILKYLRYGANVLGMSLNMDSLSYKYSRDAKDNLVNNRLNYIIDSVNAVNYNVDIDMQSANNYRYDKIGNLVKDVGEGIDTIRWTVYEKINRIHKSTGIINFGYDADGNRTLKQVICNDTTINTYYVKDALGNTLAVYNYFSAGESEILKWSEQNLYGSSRLGMWQWDAVVPAVAPVVQNDIPVYDSLLYGSRIYELTNHLDNVLATLSDKKIGHDSSGVVNYYIAEELSQNVYYSFGMQMPGKECEIEKPYRYGFGGQEKENKLNDNIYTAEFWEYDSRTGRRWNVDPVVKEYESPYAVFANNPIWFKDPNGADTINVFVTAKHRDKALQMSYNSAKIAADKSKGKLVIIEVNNVGQLLTELKKVTKDGAIKINTIIFDSHGDYKKAKFQIGSTIVHEGTGKTLEKIGTYFAKNSGTIVLLGCHSGGNTINEGENLIENLSRTTHSTVYGCRSWTGPICLLGCNVNPSQLNPDRIEGNQQPLAWQYLGQWNVSDNGTQAQTLKNGITLSSTGNVSRNWISLSPVQRAVRPVSHFIKNFKRAWNKIF